MLEVSNISVRYDGAQVIWDVSLSVGKGEIVALVGANGAGKTTILKTIMGMLHPTSGSITFEGKRIDGVATRMIISRGISLVPEGRRVFPYMTVRENLELGAYIEKQKARVEKTMEWVFGLFPRLRERQSQLAGTFSGGEQQMLVVGRALMSKPQFLIVDEPSLGLAPTVVETVFGVIKMLHEEGTTILLVEQNVRKSLEISQRGYVLETGRIVLSGESSSLFANKKVKKAYLGI
ncbi:High-affinity branched-chain amino acid transport ATP-binding protein LivF [subsurface metagenome]